MTKPKRHWFIAEHKLYGYWKPNTYSNGKAVRLRLTREEAAWVNQGCKPDYRWVVEPKH